MSEPVRQPVQIAFTFSEASRLAVRMNQELGMIVLEYKSPMSDGSDLTVSILLEPEAVQALLQHIGDAEALLEKLSVLTAKPAKLQ